MAAVLGDFLRITMRGTLFDQTILNVFYYRVVSITGFSNDGYQAILDEFEANVWDNVRPIISSDYTLLDNAVQNVTNEIDILTQNVNQAGSVLVGSLPSYVCYTFRLQRETVATRNGYKRFAGVPESLVTGNNYIGSLASLVAVQDGLKADLISGVAGLAEPVIMKRPLPSPVPSSHPYASIGGSDFRGIGSQNTRKGGGWT